MNFALQYPHLANFLGAWFPDADLEGLTDSEVVDEFCRVTRPKDLALVLEECQKVIGNLGATWNEVGTQANRAFAGCDEAERWLRSVMLGIAEARASEGHRAIG